jgi:hypothetical protein
MYQHFQSLYLCFCVCLYRALSLFQTCHSLGVAGVRSKSLPWLHGQYPGIAKPVLKVRVKNQATPNNTPLFRSKSNGINLE